MRRRKFIAAIGGSVLAWPFVTRAQSPDRVRRVGILMPYAKGDAENEAFVATFKQELAKLGWADGRNVQFDERWTTDNMDVVRAEAASLMASNPDVVIASGGRVVPILMQLSSRYRARASCSPNGLIEFVKPCAWRTSALSRRANFTDEIR